MKCDVAQEKIVLVTYGELPDEHVASLEQHLAECEACNQELRALLAMHEALAYQPSAGPSPNLVAQSRMRLDEELDNIPPHGWITRLRSNLFAWIGHIQSAPALMTLLIGVGFLTGNFTKQYQVTHSPNGPTKMTNSAEGVVGNITGVVQTPNTEMVQVNYNRIVPETMQGSLDNPVIRQLLLIGTKAASTSEVRTGSVTLLAGECRIGHECGGEPDSTGILNALLVSLRYDSDAGVRMQALEGLQSYVSKDQRVRDGVLEALSSDADATVRKRAIGVLRPVRSDSSVRQVMRKVSTTDANPYIRTVSIQALQGTATIQ